METCPNLSVISFHKSINISEIYCKNVTRAINFVFTKREFRNLKYLQNKVIKILASIDCFHKGRVTYSGSALYSHHFSEAEMTNLRSLATHFVKQ